MPLPPLPFSVVVIALNEEQRIGDCLDSVRALTDDIVVVDAFSRDRTIEISQQHGARVFQRRWSGYSDQKNFGNSQARHSWILSLDADERVSPKLARELRREFSAEPRADVFSIRFENYFGARKIRFGAWNPEWHPRLFDRRKISWGGRDVHEGLCSSENTEHGRMHGTIHHLTVSGAHDLARKSERYAGLFSAQLRRNGKRPNPAKVWLNPAWRFARDYVLRLGFLDGLAGMTIAWEGARYTHLKYAGAYTPRELTALLSRWSTATAMSLGLALIALNLPSLKPTLSTEKASAPHAVASTISSEPSDPASVAWIGDDEDASTDDLYSDDDDDDILV